MLPADKLQAAIEAAGIDIDKPVVSSCGSGITACILSPRSGAAGALAHRRLRRLLGGVGPAERHGGGHGRGMSGGDAEATRLIHGAAAPAGAAVATVNPPIQRGSTVLVPTAAQLYGDTVVTYGRAGLSTQDALRRGLSELEEATDAFLFPSGAAAIAGALLDGVESGRRDPGAGLRLPPHTQAL